MGLQPASVINALIKATFTPADLVSLPENFSLPLIFSSVSNIKKQSGVYTPVNDTLTLKSFSASDQANFALLIVDQPAVLRLDSNAGVPVNSLCIQRFFYVGLTTLPGGLLDMILNGAAAGPEVPMQQGVPCNWTLIYGKASIT